MVVYLLKYRFIVLCSILFVLMVLQAINGQWGGDFWEHAAVVRELATHPFSPKHPILLLDAPHSFYSPYALGIALVSRTTGLDSVTTLSAGGDRKPYSFPIQPETLRFRAISRKQRRHIFLCASIHPFSLGDESIFRERLLQSAVVELHLTLSLHFCAIDGIYRPCHVDLAGKRWPSSMDHSHCGYVGFRLAHASIDLHLPCRGPSCDTYSRTTRI